MCTETYFLTFSSDVLSAQSSGSLRSSLWMMARSSCRQRTSRSSCVGWSWCGCLHCWADILVTQKTLCLFLSLLCFKVLLLKLVVFLFVLEKVQFNVRLQQQTHTFLSKQLNLRQGDRHRENTC